MSEVIKFEEMDKIMVFVSIVGNNEEFVFALVLVKVLFLIEKLYYVRRLDEDKLKEF